MVSELRATAARYPADRQLRRLIAELRVISERFAELRETGVVSCVEGSGKAVEHPQVGLLTPDCNVLCGGHETLTERTGVLGPARTGRCRPAAHTAPHTPFTIDQAPPLVIPVRPKPPKRCPSLRRPTPPGRHGQHGLVNAQRLPGIA